jgi:membrane-associated protein
LLLKGPKLEIMVRMFISADQALSLLEHYKYLLIFPIAVIEGPIIIIISGFLVKLGVLQSVSAYIILVIADVIGDCLYYTIGRNLRKWTWIKKYVRLIGYTDRSEAFLESHFRKHKGKTFLMAKFSHGIGGTIQISSGVARVDFKDFLFYSVIGTLPKTLILMLLGYYLGGSYLRIDNFFNHVAFITLGVLIVVIFSYVVMQRYFKKSLSAPDKE